MTQLTQRWLHNTAALHNVSVVVSKHHQFTANCTLSQGNDAAVSSLVTVTAEDANFGTVGVFTRQQLVTVFPKLSGEWVALMPAANQTCHPYQGCYCAGAAAQRQLVTGGEVDVVLPRGRYVICHSELTNPMEDSDFTLQAGVGTPPMTPGCRLLIQLHCIWCPCQVM